MYFRRLRHVDKFHLHLLGPPEEGSAFAAGNAACTQAGRVREGEALAIVCVKGFDFERGAVVLREQSNAAVRQCPVHVHEEQFDLRSAFLECGSEFGKIGQPSLQRNKEQFRLRLSLSHAQTQSRARTQMTVIVVTHDPPSAFRIADRIAMLHKGTFLAVGAKDEIRSSEHPRIRQFLDRVPGKMAEGPTVTGSFAQYARFAWTASRRTAPRTDGTAL